MIEFNKAMADATPQEMSQLEELAREISIAISDELQKNKITIEAAMVTSTLGAFIMVRNILQATEGADPDKAKDIMKSIIDNIYKKPTPEEEATAV